MIELMSWNLLPPTTARPSLQAIVLGHTFAFMQMHTSNFGLTGIVSDRESVIGIIGNRHVQQNGTSIAFLSVDTFFFFSGFLAFYSMLTTIQSLEMNSIADFAKKSGLWAWAVLIHRYMRLVSKSSCQRHRRWRWWRCLCGASAAGSHLALVCCRLIGDAEPSSFLF